jgi:hypothetical protein
MTGIIGLLTGSVATLVAGRLARRLTQFPGSLPVDLDPFLQRVNMEEARAAFNGAGFDEKFDYFGWRTRHSLDLHLRRDLHARIAESRAYLERMCANALVIQRHADNAPQRTKGMRRDQAEESRKRILEAAGMLEGAELFERDAALPEYSAEADKLRSSSARLRSDAKKVLAEDAERKKEILENIKKIDDARYATRDFRRAAGVQLFKINLLTLVLRFDKWSIVSTPRISAWWLNGIDNVFHLYERTKEKAAAYASLYQEEETIQANM